jgi:hypothetical protein
MTGDRLQDDANRNDDDFLDDEFVLDGEDDAADGATGDADEAFVIADSPGSEADPEDVLFEDDREVVSEDSAFGADLGTGFPHGQLQDFDLADLGLADVEPEIRAPAATGGPVEIDVELEDEVASQDEEDNSQLRPTRSAFDDAPDEFEHIGYGPENEETQLVDVDLFVQDPSQDAFGDTADDPIYGQDEFATEEQPEETWEEEAAYAEHEQAYVDTGPPVVGAVRGGGRRRSRFGLVAGLAAMVAIAVAGTIAFVRPDVVSQFVQGTQQPRKVVLVDRVRIDRPRLQLAVSTPTVAYAGLAPRASTPANTPPTHENPPVIAPPPVAVLPSNDRPGGDPVPVVVTPPVVVSPPVDPQRVQADTPPAGRGTDRTQLIQVGDQYWIARVGELEQPQPPAGVAQGLRAGSQAFAQLHNGSFFTGLVKRVDAVAITLRLEVGEVTFEYGELRMLTSLAKADLSEVTATEHGYVRLGNDARLFGAILRTSDPDLVTLRTKEGNLSVRRDDVREVGGQLKGAVEIKQEGNDDWLRNRIRERMNDPQK